MVGSTQIDSIRAEYGMYEQNGRLDLQGVAFADLIIDLHLRISPATFIISDRGTKNKTQRNPKVSPSTSPSSTIKKVDSTRYLQVYPSSSHFSVHTRLLGRIPARHHHAVGKLALLQHPRLSSKG